MQNKIMTVIDPCIDITMWFTILSSEIAPQDISEVGYVYYIWII